MRATIFRPSMERPPPEVELRLSRNELWLVHAALHKACSGPGSGSYISDTAILLSVVQKTINNMDEGLQGVVVL